VTFVKKYIYVYSRKVPDIFCLILTKFVISAQLRVEKKAGTVLESCVNSFTLYCLSSHFAGQNSFLNVTKHHSVQNLLSSRLLSKNLKIKIYRTNFADYFVWV
jgi:hypothetical protein